MEKKEIFVCGCCGRTRYCTPERLAKVKKISKDIGRMQCLDCSRAARTLEDLENNDIKLGEL